MLLGGFVFGTFLALMLLGVPVTMAIAASAIGGLFVAGFGDSLMIVPQQILDGVDKPALLAIPFFILAGNLMNAVGMTDRIFTFALALVGHFRAGLAHVNVLASLIFAGVSGAATADIAGLGNLEIRAMRERGYRPEFAAALTVVTAIVGPIIPPSISLIVYAWLANTSVARLFLAGILPGVLVSISLMIYIRVLCIWQEMPREPRASLPHLVLTARDGLAALVAPGIIVGAILTGFTTATEAGVLACAYSILIGLVYRSLDWGGLWRALADTITVTSVIMMVIGCAQVMGWVLAVEQVPQAFASLILSGIDSRALFLLLVIGLLLVVGCFMEATPSKIILLPLLLPIADGFGVDRVQFGLIVTLSLLIGLATPPLGIGLYIAVGISGVPLERIALAALPMLLAPLAVLLLIAYVPPLTLWLPELLLGPP